MCCSKCCLDIWSVLCVNTDSTPSWCPQEILHWLLPSTHPPARCLHVFRDERVKEVKFHSEAFDSGRSLVSGVWMTFACLLLVVRDCVIQARNAWVRVWNRISRIRDLILLDAECFLKDAWWSSRNMCTLLLALKWIFWITVLPFYLGEWQQQTIVVIGRVKYRDVFGVWGLPLQ